MKRANRVLRVLLILTILIFGMLYFFQEKLIFYSATLSPDHQYQYTSKYEELFLTSNDGAVLNGLHFKVENPKGIILYCHGNAGQLDTWGEWGAFLANRYSYDVVVWDYRGYGKSTGERSQQAMLDDSFLFYEYCRKSFDADLITLYGRSLGGFFATHIAKVKPTKSLVLESTPATLLEIAQEKYPLLPAKWLLKYKFQNTGNITSVTTPTFLIHGTDDDLVPFEHGQRLFELSNAQTKELFAIEGGNHNDLSIFETPYYGALDTILN